MSAEQQRPCGGAASKQCNAPTANGQPCKRRTKSTFPCCYIHTIYGKRGETQCAGGRLPEPQLLASAGVSLRVKNSRIKLPGGATMKGLFVQAPAKLLRYGDSGLAERNILAQPPAERGNPKMGRNNATPSRETKLVFRPKERIAKYVGEVLTEAELQARYPGEALGPYVYRHHYENQNRADLLVDAAYWCSGVARYANDICKNSYPRPNGVDRQGRPTYPDPTKNGNMSYCPKTNVKFKVSRSNPRKIYLIAIKNIYDDDELYVEYGPEYWGGIGEAADRDARRQRRASHPQRRGAQSPARRKRIGSECSPKEVNLPRKNSRYVSEYDALVVMQGMPNLQQIVLEKSVDPREQPDGKGVIVTRYAGPTLAMLGMGHLNNAENARNLKRDMLIAFSGMKRVGLKHDDLYPRNVCYDAAKKSYTLIDMGKVKKRSEYSIDAQWESLLKNIKKPTSYQGVNIRPEGC